MGAPFTKTFTGEVSLVRQLILTRFPFFSRAATPLWASVPTVKLASLWETWDEWNNDISESSIMPDGLSYDFSYDLSCEWRFYDDDCECVVCIARLQQPQYHGSVYYCHDFSTCKINFSCRFLLSRGVTSVFVSLRRTPDWNDWWSQKAHDACVRNSECASSLVAFLWLFPPLKDKRSKWRV